MIVYQNYSFSNIMRHRDMRFGLGLPNFINFVDGTKKNPRKHKYKKIGKILTLKYGKGLGEQERISGPYYVMGSNGIVGNHDEYLIECPSIIVGRKGSAGEVTYTENNSWPIDTTFYVNVISENKYMLKFLYYYLQYLQLQKLSLFKGVPGLSRYDVYEAYIPIIDRNKQADILHKIEPSEQKIKKSEALIQPPQEIINKVFAREFGFDLEKFEELEKEMFFEVDISKINTALVRSTVVQNSLSSDYLKSFLNQCTILLKDILRKPIKRGKQPTYTEDGIKVIKTINIQKGKITFDEVRYVSKEFLNRNEEKAGIYQYDLLLTSTGMGRGKFALYGEEETCFADSHVSIIRFDNERLLPYFLNYYCQSFFGTGQLKYIEMHIKGTPEIYETQLNYFRILDIPLDGQQKIVDEIKKELDRQEEIKKSIEKERNRIDEIIEKAIA